MGRLLMKNVSKQRRTTTMYLLSDQRTIRYSFFYCPPCDTCRFIVSISFSFGCMLANMPTLSDMEGRWFDIASASCSDRTPAVFTVGVGFSVKVAEKKDEGKSISDKDILHPASEWTSADDGIQPQNDASTELDL